MINSLKELLVNETFINLAIIQSLSDEADPAMVEHNFTRSPYHVVAFLVAYAAANDIQRKHIIAKLNTFVTEISFSRLELDGLIDHINWTDLLRKDKHSFFYRPSFEFSTIISTANKAAFIDAIAKNSPALSKVLNTEGCQIQIQESTEKDKITVITSVKENNIWKDLFHNSSFSKNIMDRISFVVPYFKLSKSLSSKIKELKENEVCEIDCFKIKKGNGFGYEDVKLIIQLPPTKVEGSSFLLKLNQEVHTELGIYNALLGLENYCGLASIVHIELTLKSDAEFNKYGTYVSQGQSLKIYWSGLDEFSLNLTTITVENLDGILFLNAVIGVRFSSTSITPIFDKASLDYYIDLLTNREGKEGTPVRLYSKPLGAVQALQAGVQYINPHHPMLSHMEDLDKRLLDKATLTTNAILITDITDKASIKMTDIEPIGTLISSPFSSSALAFSAAESYHKPAFPSSIKLDHPSAKLAELDKDESDHEAHAGAGLEPG